MRYFDLHQALAEKKTRRLIFLMVVMQLVTVVVCSVAISVTFALLYALEHPEAAFPNFPVTIFSAMTTALVVVVVIATGGVLKMSELDGGGEKFAESMQAKRVDESDFQLSHSQRRLLNIVQELAIASGITAPPVYVLTSEPGINAMAVGHARQDAVIIVTQGCVDQLSRDQLQGVIAHEFSHILNGDIARDMWLTAATHGNYFLLITAQEMAASERSDGISIEFFLGYLLMPFGMAGAFLARFFTARIKRQSEFMADAKAVELARYPKGLSDALMMIGGFKHQGNVKRSQAIEAGHMFLVDCGWSYSGWLATHPPLDDRILRLRPDWDGYYLYESADDLDHYGEVYQEMTELVGLGRNAASAKTTIAMVSTAQSLVVTGAEFQGVLQNDRSSMSESASGADALIVGDGVSEVPDWMAHQPVVEVAIAEPFREIVASDQGAALVLAAIRLDQFDAATALTMAANMNPLVRENVKRLLVALRPLEESQKMWIFDRAIHRVASASVPVRELLIEFVESNRVDVADETDLTRWAWQRIITRRINPSEVPAARLGELKSLQAEVMILLSTVTHVDADGESVSQYNFLRAIAHTGLNESVLVPEDQFKIADVEDALDHLSYLSARQRRKLVVACTASIVANRNANFQEAWLLRAICDGLNFPMPAVLPGQALAPGL